MTVAEANLRLGFSLNPEKGCFTRPNGFAQWIALSGDLLGRFVATIRQSDKNQSLRI
jgi:hypothetical protein